MPRTIFVNLPVADVDRAADFYAAIGCTRDDRFSQAGTAAAMTWSDTVTFMLLSRDFFGTFTPKTVADAHVSTEVLIALTLDSRDAVDRIVDAAAAEGGRVDIRPVQDMGFMYGRTFEDPDGHVFEPAHMDMTAAMAAFGHGAQAQPA